MSDTLEILKSRRSCRKYLEKPVPEDVIEKIVETGTYAASGMNRQPGLILVVNNKETRDKLSKLNASIMGSENDPFYGAPQVLIVLADKSSRTYIYDGSLILGNMMNAAEELGVSSCWIHRAKEMFEKEEGKELLKSLGVEGEYEGIGNLIIGYDDNGKRDAAPRKEGFVRWIR